MSSIVRPAKQTTSWVLKPFSKRWLLKAEGRTLQKGLILNEIISLKDAYWAQRKYIFLLQRKC